MCLRAGHGSNMSTPPSAEAPKNAATFFFVWPGNTCLPLPAWHAPQAYPPVVQMCGAPGVQGRWEIQKAKKLLGYLHHTNTPPLHQTETSSAFFSQATSSHSLHHSTPFLDTPNPRQSSALNFQAINTLVNHERSRLASSLSGI